MEDYQILKEKYIYYNLNTWNVLYININNFNIIFKDKDYYSCLSYTTLVRYYIFEFLFTYKGKNSMILELVSYLKNDKSNSKLKILKPAFESESLFRIIKKYFPDNIKFELESTNYNLLNHIFIHKDKIFNEDNILVLLKKQLKTVTVSTNDEFLSIMNSKNIIAGFKTDASTIQDQKYGIDYYLTKDTTKLTLKLLTLVDKSEYEIVNHCGYIKIIINNVKSDVHNFKLGINAMRYQFLVIKTPENLIFINTKSIIEIANRNLDKIISITFDNILISDVNNTNKYIKKYNLN